MNERIRELSLQAGGMTKGQELKIVASGVGRSIKMNERIKELAEQAENYAYRSVIGGSECMEAYTKKFAELLVQECIMEIGYKSLELLDTDFYPHYQERLKKRFGIKE